MTQTTDRTSTPRPSARGRRRARRDLPTTRQQVLRGLVVGVVVVLLGAVVFMFGRSLVTADPAEVSAAVKAPAGGVMAGERFVIAGTTSSAIERPVFLEASDGEGWSRVASSQTGTKGGFRFPDLSTQRDRSYRVVLPEIRDLGQSHPEVTTGLPGVRVIPQEVESFSVLPGIDQAGPGAAEPTEADLVAEAGFAPARRGRQVLVERRAPGGSWASVAKAKQGAEGKVRFRLEQDAGTPYQFRVVAAAHDGAETMASEAQASNRWTLEFDDDFAAGVDPTTWSSRQTEHEPASSRTCAKADPSMVASGDGVATLSVARDTAYASGTCEWENPSTGASGTSDYFLNAHIGTEGAYSFRYGVAAARVKFQQPQGMHGAFWLQDSGEPEGTVGAEIDTVEFFGKGFNNGGIASFIYPTEGEEVGGTQTDADRALQGPRDSWWSRYHVFSVEWTPEEYVFRIDGVETLRTDHGVADRKVFVILSLLTSDWELKRMPEAGTGAMDVDWVRVWQDTRLADVNR